MDSEDSACRAFMPGDNRGRKGYPDYLQRIPPGWRVISPERWPINNPNPARGVPFDAEKWRFRVYGEVDAPLELTREQFKALPHVSKVLDHHCIDGWSYLGQRWTGVDIGVIMEMARVRDSAHYMVVESDRAASARFPIGQDLLLADGQGDAELTGSQGFPLRIVAPGVFGFKSRKWIDRIRFCSSPEMDQLERRFAEVGAFGVYSASIEAADPWTVDNEARKKFLRTVFAADTEQKRKEKKEEHLAHRGPTDITPPAHADEVELCKLGEIERSSGRLCFVVSGNEIVLLMLGSDVYAVEPICSHMGTDLSNGRVNGDAKTIRCPLHEAVFDLASGTCLSGSMGSDGGAFPPVRTYGVRVDGGGVLLKRGQAWGDAW